MSLLCDTRDPTTALFLSAASAQRAGAAVKAMYPNRVAYCIPKIRKRAGEILGYSLIVHFNDRRHPTPLTNSDFERVNGA